MVPWFTQKYSGVIWNEETKRIYGYSQQYINTVELVRNHFGLWENSLRRELAKEWVPYKLGLLENKRSLGVYVYNFRWDLFAYDDKGRPFVRFRLFMKLRWSDTKQVFVDTEIIIEFPNNYPRSPPRFYRELYRQWQYCPIHHTLDDGRLCVLTEGKDWHKGDTIVSAIGVALNRVLEHYQTFGV
jgi:hypothetical protein